MKKLKAIILLTILLSTITGGRYVYSQFMKAKELMDNMSFNSDQHTDIFENLPEIEVQKESPEENTKPSNPLTNPAIEEKHENNTDEEAEANKIERKPPSKTQNKVKHSTDQRTYQSIIDEYNEKLEALQAEQEHELQSLIHEGISDYLNFRT